MPLAQQLRDLFVGKTVRITHTRKSGESSSREGTCRAIHETEHHLFFIELTKDGQIFWLVPDLISATSVEGELQTGAGGYRKIELIAQ